MANVAEQSIRKHSKSFSLASRVLPSDARAHAVALYAWCRRADDAVDLVAPDRQGPALEALRSELHGVYAADTLADPVLALLFQVTAIERRVPRRYAEDLLEGMEMDVRGQRYDTMEQLLTYCYHVAGCVGLMMCHVMGLRRERALPRAAHLGMAMQAHEHLPGRARGLGAGQTLHPRRRAPPSLVRGGLADRLGEPFPADIGSTRGRGGRAPPRPGGPVLCVR